MKCRQPHCKNPGKKRVRGLCDRCYLLFRRDRIAKGWIPGTMSTEAVIAHLDALRDVGIGYRRVGELIGRDGQVVRRINGNTKVLRDIGERILCVPIDWRLAKDEARFDATGSRRRLQSLLALGYDNRTLAREIDYTENSIWRIQSGTQTIIEAAAARKIEAAFNRLQLTPGASVRAVNRAKTLGYPAPLAWDEDTLDDPNAMPDAKINVFASTRRLRSLCRMGFAQKYLSERLNIPTDKTSEILRFLGPIDYSLADAIEKLFNELRDTPKNDERLTSRRAAQGRSVCAGYGWAFPDDLGDVFKKPSKQELDSMNRSKNDRADTAKKLLSEGVSKAEIARRMSVNPTTVYFWLREAA